MRARISSVMAAVVFGAGWFAVSADELSEKGRAIFDSHKSAVVTIKLVIKQQFSMSGMGSNEDESKSEVTGTVVDPSGLTIVSLSETDPMSMFENMMSAMGRDMEGMQFSSQVTDVKILMLDGTEIPAQVVLRDRDLDLAFIRPMEPPAEPMAFVDLSKPVSPQVLDPVITLNRLGRVASREYAMGIERIAAVVSKPRTFYVPGNDPTHSGLGSPAFTADGEVVGIMVLRTIKAGGGGLMSMMGDPSESAMAIIIPAADVAEIAAQAPATGEEVKELGAEEEAGEDEAVEDEAAEGEGGEPETSNEGEGSGEEAGESQA